MIRKNEASGFILPELDVNVGSVLAIAAHPDDLEYEAAAAIALWTGAGSTVIYLLASSGEAGIAGMPPTECGPLRRTEATASAAVVGVNTVEFLEHPDGAIENGPRLRADVRAAVEAHAPDTVLITNHHGTWPSGDPNSQDHQSVGTAVIDALTPEAVADQRVKRVLVAGSPTPTHVLDVTSTVDVASDSLACHRAYLTALGHHPMAAPGYLREELEATGRSRLGSGAAIAIEVIDL